MVYDIVISVKPAKADKDDQVYSLRVEADNIAGAKLEASNYLRSKGVDNLPRSGFSIREAK